MKHLSVDEIVKFVSLTELNSESLELAAAVNGHIRNCAKCRSLVRTYRMIYDELFGFSVNCELEEFAEEFVSEKNEGATEPQTVLEKCRA